MPSETVKVMVRVRPINSREKDKRCTIVVEVDSPNNNIILTNPEESDTQKVFSYDAVFASNCLQQTVYETSAFSLVESVIQGYNGTIFAYGQTGCGKTHTMMGDPSDESLKGIIPRAFSHIFGSIDSTSNKNFLIRSSYIEIYNEEIHDLIGPDVKAKLELKESTETGLFIKGLTIPVVKSIPDIEKLMNLGSRNRSTGETAMNKDSSRSHSIFTIYIEASEIDEKGNQRITAGKLNLVDLAGSERQSKTQATGDRLKEANKINLSLSALGNVISALVDGKSSHIPYRDSKLTRLLQDSLGGNTKTVMIANVSPASDNYDETLGTLRYASRAKCIKNQPKVNEDPKDAMLREFSDEIKRLKAMLEGRDPGAYRPPVKQGSSYSNMGDVDYDDDDVRAKDEALNDERRRREDLEAKLRQMEQQMVQGGGGDATSPKKRTKQDIEAKKKYQEMLSKLKNQEQKTQELIKEAQKKEEEAIEAERKFASRQEEVETLRTYVRKLKKKIDMASRDVKDLDKENEGHKAELLDTIRMLERDVKINNAVMAVLLSPDELDKIKSQCYWSEERNEFVVPRFNLKVKKQKLPTLPGMGLGSGREEEQEEEEENDYGADDDWEKEDGTQRPTQGKRDSAASKEQLEYFKNTRNNFFQGGGRNGGESRREFQNVNFGSQPSSGVPSQAQIRTGSQAMKQKSIMSPEQYESKNPNIIRDHSNFERSPIYSKKQAGGVRLDPLNPAFLSSNMGPGPIRSNKDLVTNTMDLNSLPKRGKGQLAPLNYQSETNNGPMKLQFKATVIIDPPGKSKKY